MKTSDTCHLAILTKFPQPGNVKSRLADTIGHEAAAKLMGALLQDVFSVHNKQAYSVSICTKCSDKCFEYDFIKLLPDASIDYYDGENLRGEQSQLRSIFMDKLQKHQKVIVITSDTPGVNVEIVNTAFEKLDNVDVVIGPDSGAGYYLIGLKNEIDLFTDFPHYRTPYLDKTIEMLNKTNATYELLEPIPDLDYVIDIKRINWEEIKLSWWRTIGVINYLGLNGN